MKNFTSIAAICAALGFTATAAFAAPIGTSGLNAGAKADVHYDAVGGEWLATASPYVGYDVGGFEFTAETEINLRALDEELFQGVTLTAEYPMGKGALTSTAYASYGTDADFNRASAVIGMKFEY